MLHFYPYPISIRHVVAGIWAFFQIQTHYEHKNSSPRKLVTQNQYSRHRTHPPWSCHKHSISHTFILKNVDPKRGHPTSILMNSALASCALMLPCNGLCSWIQFNHWFSSNLSSNDAGRIVGKSLLPNQPVYLVIDLKWSIYTTIQRYNHRYTREIPEHAPFLSQHGAQIGGL